MKTYLLLLASLYILCSASQAQPPRPKFTINPRTLNFSTVGIGKTKQLNVTLRVDSSAAGDVHVVCTKPLTQPYSIVGDTAFTIIKGTSHTLTIQFAPTSLGFQVDSLYISHDGDTSSAKSPTKIRMNGTGIIDSFPKISVSPGFIFFGNVEVGKTLQRSFLIRNVSDTAKTLTGAVSEAHTPFSIQGGGGLFAMQTGDSLRIYVNFSPTNIANFTDSIVITSNADTLNKTKKIYLTGAGIGVDTFAKISVQPRQVNFGSVLVGKDSTRTITIRNTSTSQKKLTGTVGAFVGGSNQFSIVSGGGTFSLDSGQTQSLLIRFSPTMSGVIGDSLFISSNADSANKNIKVSVFGTGADTTSVANTVKVSFTTTDLDFGLTSPSTPLSLSLTIKNISDSSILLTGSVSPAKAPFNVNSQGSFALDRNESKEITVTFIAATPGVYTDSFIVTTNATEVSSKTNIVHLRAEVASSGSVRSELGYVREFSVYPNPILSTANTRLILDEPVAISIDLFSLAGEKLLTVFNGDLQAGEHLFPLNFKNISSGSFILKMSTKDGQNVLKVSLDK